MSDDSTGTQWGSFVVGIAQPDPTAYGGRAARAGGRYEAFVPPLIATRSFVFDHDAEQALSAGTNALQELRHDSHLASGVSALAETLLRSESVASSRIEGLQVTHARLARVRFSSGAVEDKKAGEVLGNVAAMRTAIDLGATADRLGVEEILEIHRALVSEERLRGEPYGGKIRQEQNWIGGNGYNPVGATFVPPPPDRVPGLLDDLAAFLARTDLPALAQAAIAHAQFETIHPFLDGNGRAGRALVYALLGRRGELGAFIPPISLVLGAAPQGYMNSLAAYQGRGSERHPADLIAETFGEATELAAREAARLGADVAQLQDQWRARLTDLRRHATAHEVVDLLAGSPVLTVRHVTDTLGVTPATANTAILQLVDREILKPLNERKWGRGWEAPELMRLVESFERRVGRRRPLPSPPPRAVPGPTVDTHPPPGIALPETRGLER
jgi:Fic family protein